MARLWRDRDAKLLLISGGPGFGKTSLLAQWRQELLKAGYKVCWLAVGPDDKNLSAFAAICFAGLASLGIAVDDNMLPIGESPGQIDRAVAAIVNALAMRDDEIHLLIDDYHHVEDHMAHQLLQKLVDHNPGNLHISLASRATPPLSVAKLRVMGLLAEIECNDLPFDLDETREFLSRNLGPTPLPVGKSIQIHEMTGGWPASLQLVAIMLKNRPSGDIDWDDGLWRSSHLPDYLAGEIVGALPSDIADFMEVMSLCRRFNAPLAEAMTGRAGAAAIIDRIEQENLLIVRDEAEDRVPWFRFHPLFTDFLRARLAKRGAAEIAAFHRRASGWFADRKLIIEAISHAIQGDDSVAAAAIAERSMSSLWRLSHLGTLHHIVNAIPRPLLASHPRLVYLASLTLALTGAPNQAAAWAVQIPEGSDPETAFQHLLLNVVIASQRDDTASVLMQASGAPLSDAGSNFERHLLLGFLVTALAAAGRFDDAYALIDHDPVSRNANDGMALLAHGTRCLAMIFQGRVEDVLPLAQDIYARHEARQGRNSTGADISAVVVAHALYERDRLDEALEMVANRQHSLKRAFPQFMVFSAVTEVRLERLRASDDAALALIELRCENFRSLRFDRGVAHLLLVQLEIFAGRRDIDRARATRTQIDEIAEINGGAAGLRAEIAIIAGSARARIALLERDYETGLEAIARVAPLTARLDRGNWLVTQDLLRAQIEEARGRSSLALDHMRTALQRGAKLGLVRTFVDEGPSVLHLLRQALATTQLEAEQENYARQLVDRFAECPRIGCASPPKQSENTPTLTPREIEILRLVAVNMSNQRIALAIGITLETVKWNLKNIFQKLAVSSRYDATASARRTGLVD